MFIYPEGTKLPPIYAWQSKCPCMVRTVSLTNEGTKRNCSPFCNLQFSILPPGFCNAPVKQLIRRALVGSDVIFESRSSVQHMQIYASLHFTCEPVATRSTSHSQAEIKAPPVLLLGINGARLNRHQEACKKVHSAVWENPTIHDRLHTPDHLLN